MANIIDIEVKGSKIFKNDYFYVEFRNTQRVFQDEIENHIVTKLSGSNYRNHIMAFAGVNASGKTTALKLINFILEIYIKGKSLNGDFDIIELLNNQIEIQLNVIHNKKIFQIVSTIKKVKTDNMIKLVFEDEVIKSKKVTVNESKNSLLDFEDSSILKQRSTLSNSEKMYLQQDFSIFPSAYLSDEKISELYVINTLDSTDINFLTSYTDLEIEFVQYLDNRIEEFYLLPPSEMNEEDGIKDIRFTLKFYNEKEKIVSAVELGNYLSSGTIKGIHLLSKIKAVLITGGYLIIDELENHFNRSIVENIISFFQSDVNINGATLVFSTHYSELLDSVERKDAIKIFHKNFDEKHYTLDGLDELAKEKNKDRSDIKNSDLFLSGIFGTAPSYQRYFRVKKSLSKQLSGEKYE